MIGQIKFKKAMQQLIHKDSLPRFMIICGPEGHGKRTACRWISKQLGESFQTYTLPDIKVETVRDMIDMSYKQKTPTLIIIPDADLMSLAGKNSLLKVTEEPPNNAYIIMTLQDINNTLDTIKSRAVVHYMDSYRIEDLKEYFISICPRYTERQLDLILKLSLNPGQINKLVASDVEEFYAYTEKVVDNIAKVSGANAFKIANKVAIKEDAEGYDIRLFLHMFNQVCLDRLLEDNDRSWEEAISIACEALDRLRVKGINRQFVIDKWILEVREAWMFK